MLLLAYACTPYDGSENATGWNRAVHTARFCDTWVICEQRECEREITRYLHDKGAIRGLNFEFVPKSAFELTLERIPGLYYLSYNCWHRRAYRAARRLHRDVGFDLVHQANMCGYREPGYLWKLDAPFVWGPLGGTQNYPWRFLGEAGLKGASREVMRSTMNNAQLWLSPRIRRAARRADVVLAANSTVARHFERAQRISVRTLTETGISSRPSRSHRRSDEDRPLRILWSGEIEPWKALGLLIKAVAALPDDVRYELRIIGEGSQRARFERLAQTLGVQQHCTWTGRLPLRQALKQYDWADVFAFTSLRDTTGTVVCEALAAGLPILCLNHQGVGDIVDATCGMKIPVTTPRKVIADLNAALSRLARDRELRGRLGEGAVRRADEYEWTHLVAQTVRIYAQILSAGEGRAATAGRSSPGLAGPLASHPSSGRVRVGAEP